MELENIHPIMDSEIHLEHHLPKIDDSDLMESAVNCVFYREHACLAPTQTYMMCKNCSHCNNLSFLAAKDIFQRIVGTAIMLLNHLGFEFKTENTHHIDNTF